MDVNPASGLGHGETLRALHDQLLPEYRTARIKIVTLALSEEADRTLLQDIAIATGGQFFYAPRSEALSQALFSIFDGLKSPDLVPADGPQVLIDSSVKEATFFILSDSAKEDVALIRPDGNRINRKRRDPSVKWHIGKDYVLVTIQEPLAGEWHVETTHQRPIRVAVITDMRLEVAANHESYFIDQQAHISARLVGDGELGMVSLSLAELIYTAEVTPPGLPTGMRLPLFRSGDSGLANTPSEPATLAMGQWVSTIYSPLPVPGEYQGRVVAWAPTFSREKSFFFRVLPTPAQSMPVTSPPHHLSTSEGAVPKGHLAVAETAAPVTPLGTASPADILQPTTEVETASLAPWVHVIQQWAFAHLILLTLAGLALVGYRVATGAWWIKRKTPDTETLEI
jgi:hypothetical protein